MAEDNKFEQERSEQHRKLLDIFSADGAPKRTDPAPETQPTIMQNAPVAGTNTRPENLFTTKEEQDHLKEVEELRKQRGIPAVGQTPEKDIAATPEVIAATEQFFANANPFVPTHLVDAYRNLTQPHSVAAEALKELAKDDYVINDEILSKLLDAGDHKAIERLHKALDTNHNGKVSAGEITTAAGVMNVQLNGSGKKAVVHDPHALAEAINHGLPANTGDKAHGR